MIRVSLDTNIIIKATKVNEIDHDLTMRLIEMHKAGQINLQVVAANALEYGRSMTGAYRSLHNDLTSLGFSEDSLKILSTTAIVGMAYLNHSYLPSEEAVNLTQKVWDTIFSPLPMDHKEFCEHYSVSLGVENDQYVDRRWQNHMCDVMTVVEYIQDCQQNCDVNSSCILVTADGDDILRHSNELKKLGARQILSLRDCINKIMGLISTEIEN